METEPILQKVAHDLPLSVLYEEKNALHRENRIKTIK